MSLDMSSMTAEARKALAELTAQANEKATKAQNANNAEALAFEARENSDDPTVVAYREWLEKIEKAIEEKTAEVDSYMRDKGILSTEEIDVEALKVSWKEHKAQHSTIVTLLKNLDPSFALDDTTTLVSFPGAGRGSGGGTSGPRPRFAEIFVDYSGNGQNYESVYRDVKDPKNEGQVKRVSNFTIVSQELSKKLNRGEKVEVKDLQAACFDEAGTNDVSSLNGKPIVFAFSIGKGDDAKNVMIKAIPVGGSTDDE